MATLSVEQAKEITKCRYDVSYFARNYCWIRHPAFNFPIRFTPWAWQESLLYLWQLRRNTITNKSRQIGWSWNALVYALWLMNFNQGVEVYLISATEEKAKSLMRKLRFIFNRLPTWLRANTPSRGGDSTTKLAVRIRYHDDARNSYDWGESFVSSLTTTGASGAGESATLVVADEVGLWKERQDDEVTWAAVAPTTTHGGQLIITSTPRGYGGVFHRIWVESIANMMNAGAVHEALPFNEWNLQAMTYFGERPGFIPFKAHYSMCYHDEDWIDLCCRDMSRAKARRIREHFTGFVYDEAWRNKIAEEQQLHSALILQEFELVFDKPGNAVFDSSSLTRCYKPPGKYPGIKKAVEESRQFFIGCDSAEGMSRSNRRQPDYNSITALNEKAIQVSAIHNRDMISEWAGTTDVNPVTGAKVEIKGTVLRFIEGLLPCDAILEKQSSQAVFNRINPHMPNGANLSIMAMSSEIKRILVKDLAYAIENGMIVITDYFTLECLRQYISKGGGKYEAAPGFYDDPVVSLMWAFMALKRYGYYTFNTIEMTANTQRVIAIKQEDDLTPEEVEATRRSRGRGPMMMPPSQGDPMPPSSPSSIRPFRGRGRPIDEDFQPGRRYYDRHERLRSPRLRQPRR
jgi:hypothetical protein